MVVTNLADVSADMETLYHLLETAAEEISSVADAEDLRVLGRGRALLAVFEERFYRLYHEVVVASCKDTAELARLNRAIPF